MKAFRLFVLIFTVVLLLTSCKQSSAPSEDERILNAIDVLSEYWSNEYNELNERSQDKYKDKYLEIVNTRIINIKDEIDSSKEAEFFQNIDYIVEFELVSNYYNTSPYYFNAGINNCVVVLKDGTMSLEGHSPLNSFRAAAYETDFSSFTESIEDFHGEYDRVLEIK